MELYYCTICNRYYLYDVHKEVKHKCAFIVKW